MDVRDHRLRWADIPERLRVEIARELGSSVEEAVGQRGGYSPSLAARCRLVDGRRVFIKAVSSAQNPESPVMMRREVEIAACLPPGAPAPALLHVIDDDDWIVLVFEDVDGALPQTPWDRRELDRVIDATLRLGRLTPRAPLHSVVDQYGPMFVGWRNLAAEGPGAVADPWCRNRLDELAAAEARWENACSGDQLIHGDVRSDNVLLTLDGRVVFVDWTATCIGAGWFDVLVMLPVIELEGGGRPEAVMERSGLGDLDRDQVVPLVAALAGYFADRGRLPDPPGLPTLRSFQRAQGEVALAWLRRAWDAG